MVAYAIHVWFSGISVAMSSVHRMRMRCDRLFAAFLCAPLATSTEQQPTQQLHLLRKWLVSEVLVPNLGCVHSKSEKSPCGEWPLGTYKTTIVSLSHIVSMWSYTYQECIFKLAHSHHNPLLLLGRTCDRGAKKNHDRGS